MPIKTNKRVLFAYLGEQGTVHSCLTGTDKITNTKKTAHDFCCSFEKSKQFKEIDAVCLVGLPDQSELVFHFNYIKSKGFIKSLRVCGNVEKTNFDPKAPDKTILHMKSNTLPASLGGYHELNSSDVFCLSTLKELERSKSKDDTLRKIVMSDFPKHPLYKHVLFSTDFDLKAVVELMSKVIDPRYFLMSTYEKTKSLVKSIWFNSKPGLINERTFAWKVYENLADIAPDEETRISQVNLAVLSFILIGWTSVISASHNGRIFVPNYYFPMAYIDESGETAADLYKEHMAATIG